MPPEKVDVAYLWDMRDAAQATREFVSGKTFHHYQHDRMRHDRMLRGAVERHIEIIGEAANRVSLDFQASHPEIPWRRIVAQRHVIAHGYGEIRHELIWKVATVNVPELITQLEPLIPKSPS